MNTQQWPRPAWLLDRRMEWKYEPASEPGKKPERWWEETILSHELCLCHGFFSSSEGGSWSQHEGSVPEVVIQALMEKEDGRIVLVDPREVWMQQEGKMEQGANGDPYFDNGEPDWATLALPHHVDRF